jgi:hypothetical protein
MHVSDVRDYAALVAITVENPRGACGCLTLLGRTADTSRTEWARIAVRSSLACVIVIACGMIRLTNEKPRSTYDRGVGLA